jgi:hypothetical protein
LEGLRQEQVILFLAMSYLLKAMRRSPKKLGLARAGLVIGVSASPICYAERLPWNEV